MSPLVQESAPYNCPIWALFNPCMAPFTIQPHVVPFKPHAGSFKWKAAVVDKPAMHQNDQHNELSHMGPRSAPYNCPIQAPFHPCLAPFTIQPHAAPFKPHAALFKRQREKGRYQNDQHNELSHMRPRSAPYNCPVWAPFDPLSAPFTVQPHAAPFNPCMALFTIQPSAGALFRGDDF